MQDVLSMPWVVRCPPVMRHALIYTSHTVAQITSSILPRQLCYLICGALSALVGIRKTSFGCACGALSCASVKRITFFRVPTRKGIETREVVLVSSVRSRRRERETGTSLASVAKAVAASWRVWPHGAR